MYHYTPRQVDFIIQETGVKKYKIAEMADIHVTNLSKWLNGHTTQMKKEKYDNLMKVLHELVVMYNIDFNKIKNNT